MDTVRKYLEKINTEGRTRFDEPLWEHTTFRIGGKADAWVQPVGEDAPGVMAAILALSRAEGAPLLVLGGGANVVVSDRGVRGIVLDTGGWVGCSFSEGAVTVRAGTSVDAAVEACAERGLSCLESLYGMPGSVGGAVYMNARCYGFQVSDRLVSVLALDPEGRAVQRPAMPEDWDYKRSPFQDSGELILQATFRTAPRPEREIRAEMSERRSDREAKGHYRLPSAGSAFKNDRAAGAPTGKIVDELGLRGTRVGGAKVADWHGNIIVNVGGATAADVRALVDLVAGRVLSERGIVLEPEILFVGDWAPGP